MMSSFEEDLIEKNERMKHVLSVNIKKTRRSRKLSQQMLADMSGLHRTYISDLENAKGNPTLGVVIALATCLNVSVFDLLKGI
jgi:transcriptional regulator with XRE-family HTH domain